MRFKMKTLQLLIYALAPLSVILTGCGRKEFPSPPGDCEITYSHSSKDELRPQSKRKSSPNTKDNWANIVNVPD